MTAETTYVVLPTYNERGNLRPLVEALLGLAVPGLRVLVVDDASPDGTGQLAEELAAEHAGRMEVLHRSGKHGLGTAYCRGFALALERGADCVVQMDADFSHPPEVVPALLATLSDHDVAIGSRYTRGGGTDPRWTRRRRLISRSANLYARLVMGLPIADVTGGFKAYRRHVLEAVDLKSLQTTGFGFQVEVNYRCHRLGFRMSEVPFVFQERRWGRSKIGLGMVIEAGWKVWYLRLRYRSLRPSPKSHEEATTSLEHQRANHRHVPSPAWADSHQSAGHPAGCSIGGHLLAAGPPLRPLLP
jgi:dolichol-phosphate mannosyltransferase